MAAGDPDLVLKHEGRVLVPFFPDVLVCRRSQSCRLPNTTRRPSSARGCSTSRPAPTFGRDTRPPKTTTAAATGRLSVSQLPVHAVAGRPDIVLGVVLGHVVAAAQDVDLVAQHDGLMIGARRPAGVGGFELPVLAVRRRPDVVLQTLVVAEVVVLGAAEHPHPALELDQRRGNARRPLGRGRDLLPLHAVARTTRLDCWPNALAGGRCTTRP